MRGNVEVETTYSGTVTEGRLIQLPNGDWIGDGGGRWHYLGRPSWWERLTRTIRRHLP